MAYVIAVCNLKGGCGKTTIAVNLAAELTSGDYKVVLVDADAQGTAKFWARAGKLPFEVFWFPISSVKPLPDSCLGYAQWIPAVLRIVADYVLIDSPPHSGPVSEAIIGIADLVIVPVSPSQADIDATSPVRDLIQRAREARSGHGPDCLIVPSKVDSRTCSGRELRQVLKGWASLKGALLDNKWDDLGPTIRQRAALVDALGARRAVRDYEPGGSAHEDFRALARRVRRFVKKSKAASQG